MRIFILFLSLCTPYLFAQKVDSVKLKEPLKATANLNISNNGLSLFPNFSLGRPAAIVNLSLGERGFAFEPELRWGLDGKPWSYIYWLRYRTKTSNKFTLQLGAHPAFIVAETPVIINGKSENRFITQRFVAAEINPTWRQSEKFQLGLYLIRGQALDDFTIQKSTFVSLMPKFPKIDIIKDFYLSFFPQVFYLAIDETKGTYFSETLFLSKQGFPVNLSSVFTYKIDSTVPGDKVVWNIGLNFKFK